MKNCQFKRVSCVLQIQYDFRLVLWCIGKLLFFEVPFICLLRKWVHLTCHIYGGSYFFHGKTLRTIWWDALGILPVYQMWPLTIRSCDRSMVVNISDMRGPEKEWRSHRESNDCRQMKHKYMKKQDCITNIMIEKRM